MDEAPQTGRLCSNGWIGCMTAVSANCRVQTAHDRNRQTRGRGSKAGQRPYKAEGGTVADGVEAIGRRRTKQSMERIKEKTPRAAAGFLKPVFHRSRAQVFSCFFPMACAIMPKVSRTFADFRVRAASAPRRDEAKGGKKNEEVYSTCP